MSVATGSTTSALLNTAGLSGAQVGAEVLLDLPNKSVFMGQGGPALIKGYSVANGYTLSAPVIAGRSTTSRTRGTDDNNELTFSALSGTAVQFTKQSVYDAWQLDDMQYNDMRPEELRSLILGGTEQSVFALRNSVDAAVLGLYSSAAYSVGGGGVNFAIDALAEAKKRLKVGNAQGRIYAVLPATQDDKLSTCDELTRYDARGEGRTMVDGTDAYKWQGIEIFTSGNCPTSGGVAHGLVFSEAGIRAVFRDLPKVSAWYQEERNSHRLKVVMDWAYANSFSDWIVDFQTTDA